jgi:hypothetical protein
MRNQDAITTLADRLAPLAGCSDVASLKSALADMCVEFGGAASIDIMAMAQAEKRLALCFLRLQSEMQESRLIAKLGLTRFGKDVLVIVELPNAPRTPSPAALPH